MAAWRILIQFQEKKVSYLVHVPTEEQQRGYHKDRIYADNSFRYGANHLQLFIDATTPKDAKAKARQLLLEYIRES